MSEWIKGEEVKDYFGTYAITNNQLIITIMRDNFGVAYDKPEKYIYNITGENECEREYNGKTLVYKLEE